MRAFMFPIVVLAMATNCSAAVAARKTKLHELTQVSTERQVIGSVADVFAKYERGASITIIHILEFKTDAFPAEPNYLRVRLCGQQIPKLGRMVHTNVVLVYDLASRSRTTGCLGLIRSAPWSDASPWQAISPESREVKRSKTLENIIQNIINGSVTQ